VRQVGYYQEFGVVEIQVLSDATPCKLVNKHGSFD